MKEVQRVLTAEIARLRQKYEDYGERAPNLETAISLLREASQKIGQVAGHERAFDKAQSQKLRT